MKSTNRESGDQKCPVQHPPAVNRRKAGVGVAEGVGVSVTVAVAVGDCVTVGVEDAVGWLVGVAVGEYVGVDVRVAVAACVGEGEGVSVAGRSVAEAKTLTAVGVSGAAAIGAQPALAARSHREAATMGKIVRFDDTIRLCNVMIWHDLMVLHDLMAGADLAAMAARNRSGSGRHSPNQVDRRGAATCADRPGPARRSH